ncbi:MAG: EutN/CcmL family microcompartment protein [Candidatus Sumerlaeia bacterium]|nr:EutN/CcmL family microcompartment protein [Candidatus Sumerlaeia bacterium]
MDLARVVGTVVATQRDPALAGYKLALVQPLDSALKPVGGPVVALDATNRNRGEIVYLVRSGDAMFAHPGDHLPPVDCAIGGQVDRLDREDGTSEVFA